MTAGICYTRPEVGVEGARHLNHDGSAGGFVAKTAKVAANGGRESRRPGTR